MSAMRSPLRSAKAARGSKHVRRNSLRNRLPNDAKLPPTDGLPGTNLFLVSDPATPNRKHESETDNHVGIYWTETPCLCSCHYLSEWIADDGERYCDDRKCNPDAIAPVERANVSDRAVATPCSQCDVILASRAVAEVHEAQHVYGSLVPVTWRTAAYEAMPIQRAA